MATQILAVKLGKVENLMLSDGSTLKTAIRKTAVNEAAVNVLGAEGNEVGDIKHHGGVDKALFFMSSHSLDQLSSTLNLAYDYTQTTMFGENFVVSAIDENNVCVGDIYQIGNVKIEISQPRKPCNSLSKNTGIPETRRVVIDSGWIGWYARVLQNGIIQQGDEVLLISRPYPNLTITQLHHCLAAPAKTLNPAFIETALACEVLAEAYKVSLETQLQRCREGSDKSAFFNTPYF